MMGIPNFAKNAIAVRVHAVRLILCMVCCSAAFSPTAAVADACSEYNASYYCDNGKVYSQYNNELYDDQGRAWSSYGSSIYGPAHQAYSEYGNTLYDRNGKAWSTYGNTIYQPDGSSCSWYAKTLYCQTAPDNKDNAVSQDSRPAILMQSELHKADGY